MSGRWSSIALARIGLWWLVGCSGTDCRWWPNGHGGPLVACWSLKGLWQSVAMITSIRWRPIILQTFTMLYSLSTILFVAIKTPVYMPILVTYFYLCDYYLRIIVRNTVDGVMIILLVLSVVDIVFEPRSCQTKDYQLDIFCFSAAA